MYHGHNTPSTYDMSLPAASGTVTPFISNQFKQLVSQKLKNKNFKMLCCPFTNISVSSPS